MVIPAALGAGSLGPYLAKAALYAPYAIVAFKALYSCAGELGEKYGSMMRQIHREYAERGFDAIKEHRGDILKAALYASIIGVHRGYEIYRQVKQSLGEQVGSVGENMQAATVQATLIIFGSLALTYFTLIPQKTTAHVIVPISTNIVGMILSFILLCAGTWLILRKDRLT